MSNKDAVAETPPTIKELKNEETFHFEQRGEDRKMYSGSFTFKRFTIAEIGRVGAEIARLNGGLPVDETADMLNAMLVHFKFGVKKAPEWFNPEEAYDVQLYQGVFNLLLKFEQKFHPTKKGPVSTAPPDGEGFTRD